MLQLMTTRKQQRRSVPPGPADDVERFLSTLEHESKPEIAALRRLVRSIDPAVREGIKWNAPSFYTTEHFATFNLRHKGGVQLVLHLGVQARPDIRVREAIVDPEALLQWRSADRATVTFKDLREIDVHQPALVALLRQWLTFV